VRAAKKFAKEAAQIESCSEWWEKNRQAIPRHELEAMKAQHELVLDQLHWMEKPLTDPNDPDYVSLEEGTTDLVEFVRENPCPHLGYISRFDLPADWGKFWLDKELLARIRGESLATRVYADHGIYLGLPDWLVERFLMANGWTWKRVAELLRYHVNNQGQVSYD
jgi:hypothetical protein